METDNSIFKVMGPISRNTTMIYVDHFDPYKK